jgi:hypothetical protein
MIRLILLLLFGVFLIPTFADAQQQTDCALVPCWIEMINDSNVKYNEVESAFQLYFTHHEMPHEEQEYIGKLQAENKEQDPELALAVRRYRAWQIDVKPFIKSDGSIMYPQQRVEIILKEEARKERIIHQSKNN